MTKTIYEVLTQQHEEAITLLDQLAASTTDDARLRREKGHKVAIALIVHHAGESATLHERLSEFDELADRLAEHQEEHEEADEALNALLQTDVGDASWIKQLKEIKRHLEEHIADEEENLFPEARDRLDEEEAAQLAADCEDVQIEREQALSEVSL
jgi:hypothetical protein